MVNPKAVNLCKIQPDNLNHHRRKNPTESLDAVFQKNYNLP